MPHYNPLLIRNRSWILTIHKDRIFWKNLLEKTFLTSKKWVKNIQTAGYNGARTVFHVKLRINLLKHFLPALHLPYLSHYNPRFVYFLPTFWKSKTFFQWGFFRKFCPCVWLVFKSGFWSRAGYSGACTVYLYVSSSDRRI